jgi:hypothetical protein
MAILHALEHWCKVLKFYYDVSQLSVVSGTIDNVVVTSYTKFYASAGPALVSTILLHGIQKTKKGSEHAPFPTYGKG